MPPLKPCPACGRKKKPSILKRTLCGPCQGNPPKWYSTSMSHEDIERKAREMQDDQDIPKRELSAIDWGKELTAKVGPSSKMAFERSAERNTGGVMQTMEKFAEHANEWPAMTKEIFSSLYDPDDMKALPDNEQSPLGVEAMNVLRKEPSFPMMQSASSVHRVIASETTSKVAGVIGESMGLSKLAHRDVESMTPEEAMATAEVLRDMLTQAGMTPDVIEQAVKDAEKVATTSQRNRMNLCRNLSSTMSRPDIKAKLQDIASAAQGKAEAVGIMGGFGIGSGGSESGDEGINEELLAMLASNPGMMKVLKECGRLRESLSASGLATASTGRCDVVGVEPSDDVSRLVPEELALLDDADLGDYTLARLVESEAMSWKMEGDDKKESGDIILLVDRSGSMSGATMVFARSLAAAVIMNARKQKRRVVLCMFDHTQTIARATSTEGMTGVLQTLGLPASGGTNVADAFKETLNKGFDDLRDPDVLLITDGQFTDDKDLLKQVGRFPEHTRFSALMLNGGWSLGSHDWLTQKWDVNVSAGENAGDNEVMVDILASVGKKSVTSTMQAEPKDQDLPF